MKEKYVSSFVVDNQNKPQGIVTERDVVRKACIDDIRTSAVSIKEIMSSPIITIESNASVSKANKIIYLFNSHIPDANETKLGIPTDLFAPSSITVNKGDTVTVHF